jgi:hypothetical protein
MKRYSAIIAFALAGSLGLAWADEPATRPADIRSIAIWDGEAHGGGQTWVNPPDHVKIRITTDGAPSGRKCLSIHMEGQYWLGGGLILPHPVDIRSATEFRMWVKEVGLKKGGDLRFNLKSQSPPGDHSEATLSEKLYVTKFCPNATDGQWHEVVVPMAALRAGGGMDPAKFNEIHFGEGFFGKAADCTYYVHDISVDEGPPPATK